MRTALMKDDSIQMQLFVRALDNIPGMASNHRRLAVTPSIRPDHFTLSQCGSRGLAGLSAGRNHPGFARREQPPFGQQNLESALKVVGGRKKVFSGRLLCEKGCGLSMTHIGLSTGDDVPK